MKIKLMSVLLVVAVLLACRPIRPRPLPTPARPIETEGGELELVFQTGYEDSIGSPDEAHQTITGADRSLAEKNDWEVDLIDHPNIKEVFIWYEEGNPSQRFARIVTDPTDPSNKVLHFWLNEAYAPYGEGQLKGRIQATIATNPIQEMRIKQRLYLPEDMEILVNNSYTFQWLTIQEFWNDLPNSDFPFRISVNIVKPSSAPGLYLEVWGQTKIANEEAWQDMWRVTDSSFSIPNGEWMTIETYFKEGDQNNGRFSIIVTDSSGKQYTVADVTNFTYHPDNPTPDGLTQFNPMKLYAPDRLITPMRENGKTLQLYWDDFELWALFEESTTN